MPGALRNLLIYIFFLYGSIPFVRTPVTYLRENGVLRLSVAMASLGLAIWIFRGLRRKYGYGVRDTALFVVSVATVYGLLALEIPTPEERIHLLQYGPLSYLLWQAFPITWDHFRKVCFTLLTGLILGLGDELIQSCIPGRYFDWRDVILNALGIAVGLTAVFVVERKLSKR